MGWAFWIVVGYVATIIAGTVAVYLALGRKEREYGREIAGLRSALRNEMDLRLKNENDLDSARRFEKFVLNHSSDMMFLFGVAEDGMPGPFLKVNDCACQRLGFERERLLRMTLPDLEEVEAAGRGVGYSRRELTLMSDRTLLERADALQRAHIAHILEKGRVTFERTFITADGRRIPVEITAERYDDGSGRPAVLCSARDVSERRAVEKALHETQQRLRDVFANSPIGMAMCDGNRRLTGVNRAFLRAFGLPDEAELSRFDLFDNPFIPPDQRDAMRRGESVHFETCVDFEEMKRLYKTATSRRGQAYFEIYVHDLGHDENKNVKGYVVQVMDITERRRIEEALRESEKQLRQAQKMEAMGTLAGGIAHDFNNILTPILGYTEMALHMLPETDPMREFMQEIAKGSYRAKELVEQILTFSRRAEPEGKPIHILPIVKEALNLLRASAPQNIEFSRVIKAQNDIVVADPTQIHQIIMNLATNAIYAMKDRGGILEVRVAEFSAASGTGRGEFTNLKPGRYLRISVKDTGVGIEKSILDRIFEPFFTTKPRGEGTGMGLAVVHGIVANLKGDIRVESEPGVGTTFHVALPLVEGAAAEGAAAQAAASGGSEQILFVDDDEDIVKVAERMLSTLGYRPTCLAQPNAALRLFKMEPDQFRAVITDQVMPGVTGIEMAREIASIRPGVPVILCTCFSEAKTRQEAEAAGIRYFLSKPIMMREMAEVVRRAIDDAGGTTTGA